LGLSGTELAPVAVGDEDALMTGHGGAGHAGVEELFDVVAGPTEDGRGEIVLRVHVQPGAGRTAVVGRHGDALKLRVGAPPEGGRANEAVATLLATTFGVPAANVQLVGGASSRTKRYRIGPADLAEIRRLLTQTVSSGTSGNAGGRRGVR
jgi:uncharacterized protein (TIGR00251 family)